MDDDQTLQNTTAQATEADESDMTPPVIAEKEPPRQARAAATPQIEPEVLLNLETMIKDYLVDVDKMRERIKTKRDMFKQSYEQDAEYSEVEEQQKEAKRKVQAAKEKVTKTDAVQTLQNEVKIMQEEMKELQGLLSENLNHYANMTNNTSFTAADGAVLKIVRTAKLVRPRD